MLIASMNARQFTRLKSLRLKHNHQKINPKPDRDETQEPDRVGIPSSDPTTVGGRIDRLSQHRIQTERYKESQSLGMLLQGRSEV